MRRRHCFLSPRRDRGASMAEMAVLSPVYILIVIGLIYLGDMVMAKQQAVAAARYLAWKPNAKYTGSASSVKSQFFAGLPGKVSRVVDREEKKDLYDAGGLRKALKDAWCADAECYVWAGKTAKLLNGRNGRKWLWEGTSEVEFTLSPVGAGSRFFSFPEVKVASSHTTLLRGDFIRNKKLADSRSRPRHRIFTDPWAWTAYMKKNRAWSKSFYPPFVGIILDFYIPLPVRVRESE